jgi:phosphoglycerol transferase MdoB-like AlkP superfamily enzyme
MRSGARWGKNVMIAFLSLFFLAFGVNALITAYSTKNPLEFIMYFFSSSLIILISIVGIIYPVFRIRAILKPNKMDENDI